LIKQKHKVYVIVPNDYPDFLTWMKGNANVIVYNKEKNKANKLILNSDLIFCLDFNSLERIFDLGEIINLSSSKKILIDHHPNPTKFYDYSLHSSKAAATCELIYDFINLMGPMKDLDKPIAECLYAGIMTDTGSFKFSSTSSKVHRIVADLIDKGADVNKIHRLIYDNNTINKLKLLGFSISKRLNFMEEYNTAYFVLNRNDLKRFRYKKGDTEGLVNYALSIKNVNLASIIIEDKDFIKFSFRSIGKFSVNDFAKKHFNGGGHKNAAGGRLDENLDVALSKFLKLIRENKTKLIY
tara:strand:+ start:700 stop:1590 length:891 start_codon:yes stop_codon:yes gene_type:complete